MTTIADLDDAADAHTLMFANRFIDAAADTIDDASSLLDDLGSYIPSDGHLPVRGGNEGEALHPLDIAPRANGPARRLSSDTVLDFDLDRLANTQQADGGWTVDFSSASPAATLEWRAYTTVNALQQLRGTSAPQRLRP